jgi:hypothetical protein
MICFVFGVWQKKTCWILRVRKKAKKRNFWWGKHDFVFRYKLEDTGQGMQRVQQSPRVAKVEERKDSKKRFNNFCCLKRR